MVNADILMKVYPERLPDIFQGDWLIYYAEHPEEGGYQPQWIKKQRDLYLEKQRDLGRDPMTWFPWLIAYFGFLALGVLVFMILKVTS